MSIPAPVVHEFQKLEDAAHRRARNVMGTIPDGPREIEAADYQAPCPTLSPAALYGIAGDIVQTIGPHTEADPVAILFQILVAFGNTIGRTAYFVAEATRHHLNLFVLLVAVSSRGRKGSSWNQVFRFIRRADETWATNCISSSPSSGEALIWAIRDEVTKQVPIREKKGGKITGYESEIVDAGISDKRMLIFMSEFASMLRVMTRDGNTVSTVFRQLWDSDEVIRINNKNSPIKVTGPHLSSVGHITLHEYRRNIDETDKVNGFANRIAHVFARRSKCLPGAADHFYREIQERCGRLAGAEQQQATNENLLSMGQAMKLTDFNLLSTQARMDHVLAGKTVLD